MELAPCPFCGKTEFVEFMEDDECPGEYFRVICNATKGGCGSSCGWQYSEDEAIELWNRSRKLYAPSDEKLTKDDEEFVKIFDLDNWF